MFGRFLNKLGNSACCIESIFIILSCFHSPELTKSKHVHNNGTVFDPCNFSSITVFTPDILLAPSIHWPLQFSILKSIHNNISLMVVNISSADVESKVY